MAYAGQIIRLFISSTFHDFHVERNCLQERVFPNIADLCRRNGARFQPIDLRWGVSQEAHDDQRTLTICLDEVRRCRVISPDIYFLVFLGQRYGSFILPPLIDSSEFTILRAQMSNEEQISLASWYKRDDNANPPVYVLQPYEIPIASERTEAPRQQWASDSIRIHILLETASKQAHLDDIAALKYSASATELEITEGIFLPDRHDALCYVRTLSHVPEFVDKRDLYIEPQSSEREGKLVQLKSRLQKQCQESFFEYTAQWEEINRSDSQCPKVRWNDQVSSDEYLEDFSLRIEEHLTERIEKALNRTSTTVSLATSPQRFLDQQMHYFIGRQEAIDEIYAYLEKKALAPLLITGPSGSGKTMIMEYAAQRAQQIYPSATVQKVFIGLTPTVTSLRTLLTHLNNEMSLEYSSQQTSQSPEQPLSTEESTLIVQFQSLLKFATVEHPLIIFLDALDQLQDQGQFGRWIPDSLPDHVHLVLSTISGDNEYSAILQALQNRYPQMVILDLEKLPLSVEEARALMTSWLEHGNDVESDAHSQLQKAIHPGIRRMLQQDQMAAILDGFVRSRHLPLYLRFAYEEARHWTSYQTASELKLPLPSNISELLQRRFTSLSDPRNHGSILVSHTLGYLGAARIGLAEDEIVALLSHDPAVMDEFRHMEEEESEQKQGRYTLSPPTDNLPVVIWSRLYFDLEPYLTEFLADNTALIRFYHRLLHETVARLYLQSDTLDEHINALARHHQLARFFMKEELIIGSEPNLRKLSEQPYQQTKAGMLDDAYATLTNLTFLEQKAATGKIQHQLIDRRVVDTYMGIYALQEDMQMLIEALKKPTQ